MTRRTRNTVVAAAVLAALGLAGGGVAIASDGGEASGGQTRFVVEEDTPGSGAAGREDCPEKNGTGGTTPSDAAEAL
ncbi:hypothetical protein OG266_36750 [Streptomyces sp. NBC_00554]|uniref:hypothetical protein n=1 Tax=Streptomyces sp. NBC_00554 TaxID=2903661 RepID=UPI00352C718C|nr:hypothetical protein OG266_36750 [Streptomyces sp. NBC_00554]